MTATEARAAGCYKLMAPVRDLSPEFSLLTEFKPNVRGRGGSRLISRRGPNGSTRWSEWYGDSVMLAWGRDVLANSDPSASRPRVVALESIVAYAAMFGDTLVGYADWKRRPLDGRTAPQALSYDFLAKRVTCPGQKAG